MAQLTGIFEWALGVTDIMPEDCLATLGGDSLQAVHIALEIEKHFGKLPLDVFKDNPSILDLADWITSPKGKAAQVSRRASLAGGPVRHALQ
jgi:acyl carrier protein